MERGTVLFESGDIIVKEEPESDEEYGVETQENWIFSEGNNNCKYSEDASFTNSVLSDVASSSFQDEESGFRGRDEDHEDSNKSFVSSGSVQEQASSGGDSNDWNTVSNSFSDTCKETLDGPSTINREMFQVLRADESEADDDRDDRQATSFSSSTESDIEIKQEKVDLGYEIHYNYFVNSPAEEKDILRNGNIQNCIVKEDNQNESEEMGVDRMGRSQQQVIQRASFEHDDDNDFERDSEKSLDKYFGLKYHEGFQVYIDNDQDVTERDHLNMTVNKNSGRSCKKENQENNMIAQYAIIDPEKSELVGIKSVNPKKCHICGYEFEYEFHKKFHIQQIHPDSLKNDERKTQKSCKNLEDANPRLRYSKACFICKTKSYSHPYFLSLHMRQKHPEILINNKMIQELTSENSDRDIQSNKVCPVCHEIFKFAFELKYHIQKLHAEVLVEDKRVDMNNLQLKSESEFPSVDSIVEKEVQAKQESDKPGGIKLKYTMKDIISIKNNMEKLKASKEAREAMRVAKSFECRRKRGRPPRRVGNEEKSHVFQTPILKKARGRPRKNLLPQDEKGTDLEVNHTDKESLTVSTDSDVCGTSNLSEAGQNSDSREFYSDVKKLTSNEEDPCKRADIKCMVISESSNSSTLESGSQNKFDFKNDSETTSNSVCLGVDDHDSYDKSDLSRTNLADHSDETPVVFEGRPKRKRKQREIKDYVSSDIISDINEEEEEESKLDNRNAKTEPKSKRERKKKVLKDVKPLDKIPRMSPPVKASKKDSAKQKSKQEKKSNQTLPKGEEGSSRKNILCDTCGKVYTTPRTFKEHMSSCIAPDLDSPGSGYYPCDKCPKSFQNVSLYQLHVLKDHVDSSKTCPFCGKLFAFQCAMKKHMYIHTNEAVRKAISVLEDKDTSIDKDSKLLKIMSNLGVQTQVKPETLENQEQALELSVSLKSVTAADGSESYSDLSSSFRVDFDIETCTSGEPSSSSTYGAQSADGPEASPPVSEQDEKLSSPMTGASVTAQTAKPEARRERPVGKTYPCKVCSKEYTDIAYLYKHELTEHIKHTCPVCKKNFAYEAVLRKHLVIHSYTRFLSLQFSCVWCGVCCTSLVGLKNHIVTHNGSDVSHRLNCNRCTIFWWDTESGLPKTVRADIVEHLQKCFDEPGTNDDFLKYSSQGKKNRSQQCLKCDKMYIIKSEHSNNVMIRHLYRCKVCDQEYLNLAMLKDHVYDHHEYAKKLFTNYKHSRSFKCGVCEKKFECLFLFMCHMSTHKKGFRAQISENSNSLANGQ